MSVCVGELRLNLLRFDYTLWINPRLVAQKEVVEPQLDVDVSDYIQV